MKRVQHKEDATLGQMKILLWWVTVKRFASLSDAVKWLGYDDE